jgi:hypothetical protein
VTAQRSPYESPDGSTSHDQLGNTGRKTGFWLEELAAPYYKGHNVTRYDGMIMVGPHGPSARARVPRSFVAPCACAVAAFVRPRFRAAQVEWHLAIVDPLLVARLDAESLLGSAGRLVVAPYVLGKRCHIGRGSTPSVGVASTPRRGAEHASAVLPRGSSAGLRATGSTM